MGSSCWQGTYFVFVEIHEPELQPSGPDPEEPELEGPEPVLVAEAAVQEQEGDQQEGSHHGDEN